MSQQLYTSGEYLERNPGWHVEEAPWKARQVLRMLRRDHLAPQTIGEVGCGTGEILRQLQEQMPDTCELWGYDISPQAYELALPRANDRLHFLLADLVGDQSAHFDILLVMDVVEHLEDYFSFLRGLRDKATAIILHFPLDLSVQTVLRPNGLFHPRDAYGHLHAFTKDWALRVLRETGYFVDDWFYTTSSLELPTTVWTTRMMRWPRRALYALNPDFAVRVLGGYRLLVLAHAGTASTRTASTA